ncbi:MAG: hypothetical protein ACK5H4_02695 [Lacrimispora sphenoides]
MITEKMKQSFRDTVTKKVNNDIYNVSHKNVEYREKSHYDLVMGDLVWVCVPILPTVQVNKKYMITKEALDDSRKILEKLLKSDLF